jgi:hypothetical protein
VSRHFLEHDPEKACPALDAGRAAIFRKGSGAIKGLEHDSVTIAPQGGEGLYKRQFPSSLMTTGFASRKWAEHKGDLR